MMRLIAFRATITSIYSCTGLRPRLHETGRMFIRMKIRPNLLRLHGSAKKFVHLTFPFTRSKKFVHLTFPFTWELPESIRKAAFRIPTAEIEAI